MKEFIFIWSIENISYSWHKTGEEIWSPYFTAGSLQNSQWRLDLYPRSSDNADYFALYLNRFNCAGRIAVNFELSCISAENSPLHSCSFEESVWSEHFFPVFGHPCFMSRHEVYARKNLYMPQDVLTLRCRMWKDEGGAEEFGQSFGRTHLKIERILSVESMNLKITEEKIVDVHFYRHKISLISVSVLHCKDSMIVVINPENVENIKYSVLKLSFMEKATGKILYVHTSSWLGSHTEEIWSLPLLCKLFNAGNQDSIENNVELLSEFVYTTGKKKTYLDNNKPYPSRLSRLISKYIMSLDCPRISQDMWNLYLEHVRCDLELMTKTTSFFVHKIVLCARSPVFLAMLTGDMKEKRNDCIEMEDITDDILKKFLFFLYTDSFEDIEWEAAIGLYYAAYKYHIERLKCLCCSFFLKNIEINNACELLLLADRHHEADLKRRVEDFILRNDEKVFSSSAWQKFVDEQSHLSAKTMLLRYDKERGKENVTETDEESLSISSEEFDDFISAYEGKIFSDIIIKAKDATIHAQKSVPCASSSALKKAFAKDLNGKENATETYEEKLSRHPEVFDDFRSAYEGKVFSDIIIRAKDATFHARKSVPCTRSSALKEAFAKDLNGKENATETYKEKLFWHPEVFHDFRSAYGRKIFSDIIIKAKDATFQSHKSMPCASSSALKKAFAKDLNGKENATETYEEKLSMSPDVVDDFKSENEGKENATETYEESLSMSSEEFDDFRSAYEGKENASDYYEEVLSMHPEVFDDFRSAYEGKIFSDIIIKAKDATFHAHKSVLCASSSTWKEAFAKDLNDKPSETLKMEDLEDETVSRLLLFLYSDSLVDIEWDTALKLYHAADVYQIQRLKIKCSCFFLENLETSNASDFLLFAHQQSDDNLKSVVQDFIFLHDEEIFGSQKWAEFSKANHLLANETMCLRYRKSNDFKGIFERHFFV